MSLARTPPKSSAAHGCAHPLSLLEGSPNPLLAETVGNATSSNPCSASRWDGRCIGICFYRKATDASLCHDRDEHPVIFRSLVLLLDPPSVPCGCGGNASASRRRAGLRWPGDMITRPQGPQYQRKEMANQRFVSTPPVFWVGQYRGLASAKSTNRVGPGGLASKSLRDPTPHGPASRDSRARPRGS